MSEAVEPAVPDEEVLLGGISPSAQPYLLFWPCVDGMPVAGSYSGQPATGIGVEHDFPVVILQHRSLLVINQHRFHTTTEVAEGANQ